MYRVELITYSGRVIKTTAANWAAASELRDNVVGVREMSARRLDKSEEKDWLDECQTPENIDNLSDVVGDYEVAQ